MVLNINVMPSHPVQEWVFSHLPAPPRGWVLSRAAHRGWTLPTSAHRKPTHQIWWKSRHQRRTQRVASAVGCTSACGGNTHCAQTDSNKVLWLHWQMLQLQYFNTRWHMWCKFHTTPICVFIVCSWVLWCIYCVLWCIYCVLWCIDSVWVLLCIYCV